MPKVGKVYPEGVMRQVAFLGATGSSSALRDYLLHVIGRAASLRPLRSQLEASFTASFYGSLLAAAPWLAANNLQEASTAEDRIRQIVEDAGPDGATRTQLLRAAPAKALDTALDQMVRSYELIRDTVATGGRPACTYWLPKHAAGRAAGLRFNPWHDMVDPAARIYEVDDGD